MSDVAPNGRFDPAGTRHQTADTAPPPPRPPELRANRPPDQARARFGEGGAPPPHKARSAAAIQAPHDKAKAAANRHSRVVRYAKIWLPIVGLVIAGAVIAKTLIFSRLPGLNMPAVLFSKNGLTMVEPRLTGRSRDRAYDIGATRATQDFSSPKVVNLEQLSGRIELKNDGWAKVSSRTGRYDGTTDRLNLNGAVFVTTSTGYLLRAEDADIELAQGTMVTTKPVHIEGPAGTLDAGAAKVSDGGNAIQFSGGIRMTITPSSEPTATVPDQPQRKTTP